MWWAVAAVAAATAVVVVARTVRPRRRGRISVEVRVTLDPKPDNEGDT